MWFSTSKTEVILWYFFFPCRNNIPCSFMRKPFLTMFYIKIGARLNLPNLLLLVSIASIFMIFDIECLQSLSRDAGRNPTVHALLSWCEDWGPQLCFLANRDLCRVSKSGRHHQSNNTICVLLAKTKMNS